GEWQAPPGVPPDAPGAGAVPRQPLEVRLVVLPRDVAGQVVGDQDLPLIPRDDHAAGRGPYGDLPTGVRPAPAAAVGAGVDRVVQEEVQRRPVGTPPLQLALVGPEMGTEPQADAVADQVPQK